MALCSVPVPGAMGPIYRGQDWYILELECPMCVTPNSPMPLFANFTPQQYEDLSAFLAGLGATYK